jgi:hypothetical protein
MLAGLLALSLAFVGCANGTPSGDSYYLKQWDVVGAAMTAFNNATFAGYSGGLTGALNVATNGTYDEVEDYWDAFENDGNVTKTLPENGVGEVTWTEAEIRSALKAETTLSDTDLNQLFDLIKTRGNCIISIDASGDVTPKYILVYVKKP